MPLLHLGMPFSLHIKCLLALRQMNGANGTNLLAAKLAIGTMHSLNNNGIPGSPISSSAFRPISSQSASVAGIFDPFMAQMVSE